MDSLEQETSSSSLPPADGGRAAYLVLFACAMLQVPIWGKTNTVGIKIRGTLCPYRDIG